MLMSQFYRIGLLLFVGCILATQAKATYKESKLDMKNVAQPLSNLMTGGQPSLNDLKVLAKNGTKIVVNLRSHGEFDQFDEKEAVEALGMKYVLIEVNGLDGITEENARRLDKALNDLHESTLVHCASSNRVGALLSIRANKIQNQSIDAALEFGKKSGMKSTEKKVRVILSTEG